jgi:AcrR family transcriptional regulator
MASKIRSRIVTAAVQCFSEHGFNGCSTNEIAKRADVTEGSLFRLFASKDKLFGEALDHSLAALLPQSDFQKRLANPDFRAAILDACSAMVSNISQQTLRLTIYALLEGKGGSQEKCAPHVAARISALASRIRLATKSRKVRKDVNPNNAARMLLLSLFHLRYHSVLLKAKGDKAAVENIVEIWLRGITT